MADFGTGLRAHLETTRSTLRMQAPRSLPPVPHDPLAEARRQLQELASELAGRELSLAQREAELAAEHEQMALSLARALLEQTRREQPAWLPVDELAALRARRYGVA